MMQKRQTWFHKLATQVHQGEDTRDENWFAKRRNENAHSRSEWALCQMHQRKLRLLALAVQHRVLTGIAEEIGHRAGELV